MPLILVFGAVRLENVSTLDIYNASLLLVYLIFLRLDFVNVPSSFSTLFNPICHGGRWIPPPLKEKFNYSIMVNDKVPKVLDFS